jgi:hypothetical protein
MVSFVLGFKGLPYISPNYKGDKYFAARKKIKHVLSPLGTIKNLYVNEQEGFGRVFIDSEGSKELLTALSYINKSPTMMFKFSWEQSLLEMKTENSFLEKYKSWLFIEDNNSLEYTLNLLNKLVYEEKMKAKNEIENFLFENSCEEWLLNQEIISLENIILVN